MKIRCLALLCALIVFSQILHTNCEREKGRKKEQRHTGKGERQVSRSSPQNGKGQKGRGQKGKFTSKEKSLCTWTLSEEETVTLKIDCQKEDRSVSCVFSGNPSSCPQFSEYRNIFWKQITRSLKKKKNICEDPKEILKSSVCKKGPTSAHLRLVSSPSSKLEDPIPHGRETAPKAASPPNTSENLPKQGSRDCVEDVDYIDQRKVAEEYCSELWLSLCQIVIAMVQDKKCK